MLQRKCGYESVGCHISSKIIGLHQATKMRIGGFRRGFFSLSPRSFSMSTVVRILSCYFLPEMVSMCVESWPASKTRRAPIARVNSVAPERVREDIFHVEGCPMLILVRLDKKKAPRVGRFFVDSFYGVGMLKNVAAWKAPAAPLTLTATPVVLSMTNNPEPNTSPKRLVS